MDNEEGESPNPMDRGGFVSPNAEHAGIRQEGSSTEQDPTSSQSLRSDVERDREEIVRIEREKCLPVFVLKE